MILFRYTFQLGLFGGILIASVLGFLGLKASRVDPDAAESVEEGKLVQAMKVSRRRFDTPIVGFGSAQAEHIYSIRPQVSGRVVRLSPNFAEGRSVSKGEFLFEMEKQDIEIAILEREATIAQATAAMQEVEAQVVPIDAEIRRLRQQGADLEATIRVKQQAIDLARKEVERLTPLVERGSIAKSQLEAAQIALNQHEQSILDPKSQLTQLPILVQQREEEKTGILARIETLEAQKDAANAGLEKSRLDLTRTVLASSVNALVVRSPPFGGVPPKILALGDYVAAGEDVGLQLMEDDGAMEIAVPLDISDALWVRGAGVQAEADTIATILPKIGEVRIEYFRDPAYTWTGVVDRIKGGLDETTRTLTAIVRVAEPGHGVVPGRKLPLAPGMFCRVLIPGYEHEDAIVIPRITLRADNKVYLIRDGRLVIQAVVPLQILEDEVVLRSGLEAGDVLVLSDLPSAAPGQKLRPKF